MNKTQMINEMMRIYDENETLKRQIEEYKTKKPSLTDEVNRNDTFDVILIQEGKKLLFNRWFYDEDYGYIYPKVAIKDDDNKMNFITFEQWYKALTTGIICDQKALISCSLNSLADYFKDELKTIYDKLIDKKKGEVLTNARDKQNE